MALKGSIDSNWSGSKFDFRKMDLSDRFLVRELFSATKPDRVIHLAAQAGVRYSLENPQAYRVRIYKVF